MSVACVWLLLFVQPQELLMLLVHDRLCLHLILDSLGREDSVEEDLLLLPGQHLHELCLLFVLDVGLPFSSKHEFVSLCGGEGEGLDLGSHEGRSE